MVRFHVFNFVMMSFLMMSLAPSMMASPSQLSWKDGTPELVELTRELLREGGGRAFIERNAPQREVLPTPPKVGTVRRFFAMDLSTEREYVLFATLRAVSAHALCYVENDQWEQRVTMADITALMKAFEQSTPADAHKGIYTLETEGLASIPDIDDDARLNLLILDIRDGASSGAHSFVAGYFFPFNQSQGSARAPSGEVFHSNETELLYLDCAPLNAGSSDAQGVIAHELAHLIHWGLDPEEEVWIDEGCADYAMWLTGYTPIEHLWFFEQTPMFHWLKRMQSNLIFPTTGHPSPLSCTCKSDTEGG